jgi:hypothetical protein
MIKTVFMPKLRRRTRDTYTARVKIPPDLRDVHEHLFGQRWAIKTTWPKSLSPSEALAACASWGASIQDRFDALRAAKSGQLRTLSHIEVHSLVGAWYQDYVAKYEANPGDPEAWAIALDDFGDALVMASGTATDTTDRYALLSDPVVLAALRDDAPAATGDPLIDRGFSIARATQADRWLLDHGYALTPESRAAFLDALAPRYADALTLLLRRAKGDYSRDPVRLPHVGASRSAS